MAVSGSGLVAHADSFSVTYGLPNATATTVPLAYGGVETFNERPAGTQTFTTDFGTGGVISGTYTGVNVAPADEYGGAGGTGYYAAANDNHSYSLSLSTTKATGINYFRRLHDRRRHR